MRIASEHRGLAAAGVSLVIFVGTAVAQYGGGTGTSADPYQIWTAEQMSAIGAEPNDWDKHFRLMADIDMSGCPAPGYRPIGFVTYYAPQPAASNVAKGGKAFTGVFDGNHRKICRFSCRSTPCAGLFGSVGYFGAIRNLTLVDPNVFSEDGTAGALVGSALDWGVTVSQCHVQNGTVRAPQGVAGGLLCAAWGNVQECSFTGSVFGQSRVGGLVGDSRGTIERCFSNAEVSGDSVVGGVVGRFRAAMNGWGCVRDCYAYGRVTGVEQVGGLMGLHEGTPVIIPAPVSVYNCYAAAVVVGTDKAGGLIGAQVDGAVSGDASLFWDIQVSTQAASAGGTGKMTSQMQTARTFLDAGWDFLMERANGTVDIWCIQPGQDYPRLSWEQTGTYGGGTGEPNDPYLIFTAAQLNAIGVLPGDWDRHFQLMADIDLSAFDGQDGRPAFNVIGTDYRNAFTGVFDGLGHTVSNLTLRDDKAWGFGLFGFLGPYGEVANLVIQDANVQGDIYVGPVVGYNDRGSVHHCCATGFVRARQYVGGLIGICTNKALTQCCRAQTHVSGEYGTGGLVGASSGSKILQCSAGGIVEGSAEIGGITGRQDNRSVVQDCYSSCSISGTPGWAAGIVGRNDGSLVSHCYATGPVVGDDTAGGLVARNINGTVEASFWDVQTSGLAASEGGVGRTTVQMQTARTFLDAGWDFVGETANGTEDIWWIDEGRDYPRLWWEAASE